MDSTKMEAQKQLVSYARRIAQYRNYATLENGLQPVEVLQAKMQTEIKELKEAIQTKTYLHMLHETSDVLYYAACLEEQGIEMYEEALRKCVQVVSAHEFVLCTKTVSEQLEAAALAKYCYRASAPNTKNEEHELKLIEKALTI